MVNNNPELQKNLFRQIVCARTKLRGQNMDLLGKCPMSDRYFHLCPEHAGLILCTDGVPVFKSSSLFTP